MTPYNPPEGYLYDDNSGLYYSQIIAADENGTESQIVTWFDVQTGEYSQEVYPIDENTNYVDDEEDDIEYLDGYNTVQPRKQKKRLSKKGVITGIIIGVVILLAVLIVFFVRNRANIDDAILDDQSVEELNETSAEETEDSTNDSSQDTASETEGKVTYPEETETQEWIQMSDETAKYPKASNIEDYTVIIAYIDATNVSSISVFGIGAADNRYLCNPDGYKDGDVLYRWSVSLSEQCKLIMEGKAYDCGTEKVWEYPSLGFFSAQLVYEKNGEETVEDIEFSLGVDDVAFMNFIIPEGVGVDLPALGDDGTDMMEVSSKIGPYEYSGHYAPAYAYVVEDLEYYKPSNKPHEERTPKSHSKTDEEYEMEKLAEAAGGEYVLEDSVADSYAKYMDDDYSGGFTGSPQAGLPAAGFYRSDDGSVTMDIMDDGLIAYISADSMKYEGWYTYDTEYSGYTDQGSLYYIHVHFGSPSGELTMELIIDTEVCGVNILSGPGKYGDGWLWLV